MTVKITQYKSADRNLSPEVWADFPYLEVLSRVYDGTVKTWDGAHEYFYEPDYTIGQAAAGDVLESNSSGAGTTGGGYVKMISTTPNHGAYITSALPSYLTAAGGSMVISAKVRVSVVADNDVAFAIAFGPSLQSGASSTDMIADTSLAPVGSKNYIMVLVGGNDGDAIRLVSCGASGTATVRGTWSTAVVAATDYRVSLRFNAAHAEYPIEAFVNGSRFAYMSQSDLAGTNGPGTAALMYPQLFAKTDGTAYALARAFGMGRAVYTI